jgi:hypothetical protein
MFRATSTLYDYNRARKWHFKNRMFMSPTSNPVLHLLKYGSAAGAAYWLGGGNVK